MEDETLDIRNLDEEMSGERKHSARRPVRRKSSKAAASRIPSKKPSMRNMILVVLAVACIIALFLLVMNLPSLFGAEKDRVIASINGQLITKSYYDKLHALEVPQDAHVSDPEFAANVLVPRIIFLQEAQRLNYTADEEDIDLNINNVLSSKFTQQDLEQQLLKKNITYAEFRNITRENLMISNLLVNKVRTGITVEPQEVVNYFNKYRERLNFPENYTLNTSKIDRTYSLLHLQVYKSKEQQATSLYLSQLMKKANITIYDGELTIKYGQSFATGDAQVCTKDGKPVIRFYSTSDCTSCDWVRAAFKAAVEPYVAQGIVVAYNWQLDTGDDLLTSGKESAVPKDEFDVFTKFSNKNSVPVFVFGCTYYRVGNYYNNLKQEEEEFRTVIKKMLSGV